MNLTSIPNTKIHIENFPSYFNTMREKLEEFEEKTNLKGRQR
jgi:hypothetical protein